jgi:hypothetical protein
MVNRRTEIMTSSGTLAGLGYAAAALIATVGKQPLSNPWFILSAVVGVVCTVGFIAAAFTAVPGWVRPILEGRRKPAPLYTRSWLYTTDSRFPALRTALEIGLPGTIASRKLQEEQLPWVRVVVMMGCSERNQDDDPELAYLNFEATLEAALANSMITKLTSRPEHAAWWLWSASPGVINACLATYKREPDAVAAARLELPGGEHRHGRDDRCATMILHIEPRGEGGGPFEPKPAEFWDVIIQQTLWLPDSMARMLADHGLRTSGEPPAQVGIMLQAPRDLAELVDITGRHPMRGGEQRASQAIGFFIAYSEGKSAEHCARTMIRDMFLYALKTTVV